MGLKPFTPVDEQIQILIDRGLIIEDKESAKNILLKENYYNVINGYKMPFLKRELNGELVDPEKYIEVVVSQKFIVCIILIENLDFIF